MESASKRKAPDASAVEQKVTDKTTSTSDAAAEPEPPTKRHQPVANTRLQVLLVDDSSSTLRMMRKVLEREKCDVTTATCGADALSAFTNRLSPAPAEPEQKDVRTPPFHLGLLDLQLGDMDGAMLADQLSGLLQKHDFSKDSLPLLLLTGSQDTAALQDILKKSSVCGILHKPLDKKKLTVWLKRCRSSMHLAGAS